MNHTSKQATDATDNVVQLRSRRSLPQQLASLAELVQWVIWKRELRDGVASKPPYQGRRPRRRASTADDETWCSYEEAAAAARRADVDGVGIVLRHLGGVDLDDCVDEGGVIADWAWDIVQRAKALNCYVEISVSGDGVHVIGTSSRPSVHTRYNKGGGRIEVFRDCRRYLTVSGRQISEGEELGCIDALIDELTPDIDKPKGKSRSSQRDAGKADNSPSGIFHDRVCELTERDWSIEEIEADVHEHPERWEDSSVAKFEAQGRLREEIERSAGKAKKVPTGGGGAGLQIVSSAQFVANFVPPDYLLDGVLQRGFLYALTGRTGEGKTALALLLAATVGDPDAVDKLGDNDLEHGRVLYFAGENADDIRMRWIAMSAHIGFAPDAVDVHFLSGRTVLSEDIDRIAKRVAELGGVQLIIVDTARAFFEGDDENSNAQQSAYARQQLRALTQLEGRPCVIVNCHPSKHAADDNMQPAGGGAFIAEIDGNLTCMSSGGGGELVELHWQIKLRGPDFLPLKFSLRKVTTPKLIDSKGRLITTVLADALSEKSYERKVAAALGEEEELLAALLGHPRSSIAQLAETLGWKSSAGEPQKSKVHRLLQRLLREHLVRKARGAYQVSERGKKALQNARGT